MGVVMFVVVKQRIRWLYCVHKSLVIVGATLFFMWRQIFEQQMQLIQHILLCVVVIAAASEIVTSIGCWFIVVFFVIFISIVVIGCAIWVTANGFVVEDCPAQWQAMVQTLNGTIGIANWCGFVLEAQILFVLREVSLVCILIPSRAICPIFFTIRRKSPFEPVFDVLHDSWFLVADWCIDWLIILIVFTEWALCIYLCVSLSILSFFLKALLLLVYNAFIDVFFYYLHWLWVTILICIC